MSKLTSWGFSIAGLGQAGTYSYELGSAGGNCIVCLGTYGTTYDIYNLGDGNIAIQDPSVGWYWSTTYSTAMPLWFWISSSNTFTSDSIGAAQTLTLVNLGDGNVQLTYNGGGSCVNGQAGGWYPTQWGYGTNSIGTGSTSGPYTAWTISGDQLPILIVTGSGYKLNLAGASLAGVTIANGANMQQVNLQGADLSAVAQLGSADFTYALMQGANLAGHTLSNANWTHANFSNTDLTTLADSSIAQLEHANFTGANLTGVTLAGAHLANAIFAGARSTARSSTGPISPTPTSRARR